MYNLISTIYRNSTCGRDTVPGAETGLSVVLVTKPNLDDMLWSSEQVFFRANRTARPTAFWGLLTFAGILAGAWILSDFELKGLIGGICIGAVSAFSVAVCVPKSQVIITEKRLLMRVGLLFVWDLSTPLGAIKSIENDGRGGIEIVCRDGDRTLVSNLPSLAEMISVIVARTGVDAPVILPPRLKPWGALAKVFWVIGHAAGAVLSLFLIAWIGNGLCGGPCSTGPGFFEVTALILLLLPLAIFGGAVGSLIPATIFRLCLPIVDTRMIFEAVLSPPKSTGRIASLVGGTIYFPGTAARYLASRLYGEEI